MNARHSVLLLALLAGCNRAAPPTASTPAAASAGAVTIVHPERRSLTRVVEQPGTVRAFEEAPLFAKVAGFVRVVHVDIGDRVAGPLLDSAGQETRPGQVLAEIAVPELEEEAKHKVALVAQARVEVEQAKKLLDIADAHVAAAESLGREARAGQKRAMASYLRWESEARRIEGLVKSRVIDQQTFDETHNQFRAAEATREECDARVISADAMLKKSKAERAKADVDIQAAEARRAVAEAESRRLATLVGYTKVRAPFSGVVTRRRVDTGHFVQPVGGMKTEALFTVVRADPVRVVVDVPEADASIVRKGTAAAVTVQALGAAPWTGVVARTADALDTSARTLRAEVDLPNPDGRLKPGMYVYARLTAKLPEAWTLPATALARQGDATICYLLIDGKATRTPVQIGRSDGARIIVTRRQKPGAAGEWLDLTGDEEVAATAAGLSDGQPVTPPQ